MSDRFTDLPDEPLPRLDRAADALRRWSPARPDAADAARSPAVDAARAPDLRSEVLDRARWLPDAAGDPAVAARSASDIPQAGDPVDVATGDVVLFQDDVSLPGVVPLIISRAYRSSWRAGRWFGASWASSFDQQLQVMPDRIVGVFADGRVLTWLRDPAEDGPVPLTGLPLTGPRWRLAGAGDGAFTVTDPQAGLVRRFEGRGRDLPLVSVTDRAGRQICFGYTSLGEPAWITHSGGYRIRAEMAGGRIAGLRLAGGDGSEIPLTGYRYDEAGNLAGVIDASGHALRFSYDRDGRLAGWRDRNGISYRYSHDELGRCVAGSGPGGTMSGRFAYGDRVTWWTDAGGAVTIYQLDSSSRVTAVTSPLGHVTHVWYDEYGRVTARADPLGRLTRHGYDERGNLTCITWPDGSQARVSYAESGLPVALDAGGSSWRQEYDGRGNLVRRIAPDQAVTSYGYDERANLASVTGPLGEVTTVECDPAGLPVAVTSPGGGCVRYTRDMAGRVTSITAPDGPVTGLTWTVGGQLAARVFPDGISEQREYDAEGNLISYLSPSGERSRYEYGPFDRLTAVTGPDGTRTEFRYDHAMRLTAVARAGLTWRYEYDAAGQVVAETDFNGAVTRYAYDPAGQLIGRINAVGQEVSYGYDELGLLVRREAGAAVTSFGYDAAGRWCMRATPTRRSRSAVTGSAESPPKPATTVPCCPLSTWRDIASAASLPAACSSAGATTTPGNRCCSRPRATRSGSAMTRRAVRPAETCRARWRSPRSGTRSAGSRSRNWPRQTTWLLSRRTACMLSQPSPWPVAPTPTGPTGAWSASMTCSPARAGSPLIAEAGSPRSTGPGGPSSTATTRRATSPRPGGVPRRQGPPAPGYLLTCTARATAPAR